MNGNGITPNTNAGKSGGCGCSDSELLTRVCWDTDNPGYNPCGAENDFTLYADFSETDLPDPTTGQMRHGDCRINLYFLEHLQPANYTTRVATWTYDDQELGPQTAHTDQIIPWGDIVNMTSDAVAILKITATEYRDKWQIKVYTAGSDLSSYIFNAYDTFIGFRKNAPSIYQNSAKEIYFNQYAISNPVWDASTKVFTFDYSKTEPVSGSPAGKYWHEQVLYKCKHNFFNISAAWEGQIYYDGEINQFEADVELKYTFSNGCADHIVTKHIQVTEAKYPITVNDAPVVSPISIVVT